MNILDLSKFLGALSERGIRFCRKDDLPDGAGSGIEFTDPFYRPHAHPQWEMICLLQGRMAVCINGHWCSCDPLSAQVFISGVVHGEHYLSGDTGYRMLWATIFPAAIFFHVTEYHPSTGYGTSRQRMAITPPMCSRLWQASRALAVEDDRKLRAKFHYLLMECLVFFLTEPADDNIRAGDYHEHVVEQLKHYIQEYYQEDISLDKLAGIVHYSPGHLNALFRRSEHMPLHRYINEIRLSRARQLLGCGDMLVKQVAHAVGFHDPLYFSRLFSRRFGVTPASILAEAGTKRAGTKRFPRFTLSRRQ